MRKWLRERIGLNEEEIAALEDWGDAEVHEGRAVEMLYRATLNTYNLRILAPPIPYGERQHVHVESAQDKRVLADMPAMLELVEEQLQGLLPKGYQVRITEWNK